MNNQELKEIIEELLKQPEGLKFDFKVILHIAECTDKSKQDGFRSEFIRDILALVNGNIGTAGQTAYLIVGAADKLDSDGKRKLRDSSHIRLTGKEILQKINSCCRPPIADIQTEFVDVSGTQLFVICIPPTPYLHETTQDLKLPNGKIYPRNSIFVRHGEEIDYASIAEIDAIRLEKDLWQRNLDGVKSNGVMSLEERKYLEAVKRKYQDWWEDSYAFMNEINDATWQELQLTVKTLKSNLNNEANLLSASDGDDKTTTTILPILDALRQVSSEQVLIVGKAGAGKSTILAKVLLNAAKEALQDPTSPIPVLIKLKDYQSPSDFLLLIRDAFERFEFLDEMPESEQIAYIKRLIKGKRLLLLADGVNELSSDGYKAFKKFCGDHLPMIVTNLGIQTKLEIQPLSPEKVKDFFSKKLPDYLDIRRVQELCDRVRDLGQTPLMVWMLYIIFKQNPFKETPNTRGEAYREFTDIYSREAKDEVDWIDLCETRSQLSLLAFEMTRSERSFNEEDVLKLIGKEKIRKNLLSNHLLQRDGTAGSRKVQFCHPSLQEYYAAEYILARLPELTTKRDGQKYTPFQTDYLNYLKWTEVIALMFGFPDLTDSESKQLVKQALEVDLMMGSRLVGAVKAKVQAETIELIKNISGDTTASEWLRVTLMGRTQSRLALSDLLQFLQSSNMDVAIRAANWIGVLGCQDVVSKLNQILQSDLRFNQKNTTRTVPDKILLLKKEIIETINKLSPNICSDLNEFHNPFSSFLSVGATDDLLTKFEPESTEKISLEILENSKDPNQIRQASRLLSKLGNLKAVSLLISRLNSQQDIKVYESFLDGLGEFETYEAISALVNQIKNLDVSLRKRAAKLLIENKRFTAVKELIPLLDYPEWDIKWCATDVLARFGSERAVPALLEGLMENHHRDIQIIAAELLSLIKQDALPNIDKVISILLSSLANSDYAIRRSAAVSLAQFNREESIPELLNALHHYHPSNDGSNTPTIYFKLGEYSRYPIPETTLELLGSDEAIRSWINEDLPYPDRKIKLIP
jgi:HEAT repeat protein